VSVDSELAVCGFYNMSELSDEHDLIPVMNFARAHSSYKTVASFFYKHSIGRHDKQASINTVSSKM
jgi:hypothetical protein